MKHIFNWLREQMETRKGDAETRMYRLIDEDRGDRCVYSETDVEEFSVNTWADALSILDEAEAKWEKDCCEWEWFEVDGVRTYANCKYSRDTLDLREMSDFQFCPYCGRKISEVE